jgi:Uma2 family endonuclease
MPKPLPGALEQRIIRPMNDTAASLGHYTVDRYFELGECGILAPDDRVELLDGMVIAMPPTSPLHDNAVHRILYVLLQRLGFQIIVRGQSTFVVGNDSAPQPDIAVCPGNSETYENRHPTRAHLLVEVAVSSLPQDRLTKSAIYARAGVPCYWVVNLRDRCVEVYREPDRFKSEYRSVTRATGSEVLTIDEFPDVKFEAAELLPSAKLNIDEETDFS